ncbi:hypothetical protein HCN44_009036 [Aphidius gifuensis]|uniref:Zinc phosphodiesterase ELAC protein 2 n=1 Tax=Aphidius gifuensis TaxID=684658 RepID=A0A834XYM6_APHGI|nr:ribonuclease Z, mitochondrial-like [Aphidius gifuensis]KAF7995998.1 hypothetical protein HCN44_009036 [Aphidius gifuensis]
MIIEKSKAIKNLLCRLQKTTVSMDNNYYSKSSLSKSDMSQKQVQKLLQKAKHGKRSKILDKNNVPGKIYLQILGSGTKGVPSSLYVSTNFSKYLFNCGEGSQRLANEHHLKIGQLDHIFFTMPTWKNMGGLPGMALTIQDCGVPNINLHGPRGISELFHATRRFILLKDLSVTENNCDDNNEFKDSCMSVQYVNLTKTQKNSKVDYGMIVDADGADYYLHEFNKRSERNVSSRSNNLPTKYFNSYNNKKTVDKIHGCIVYICKLHKQPGSLDLSKLVDYGVKSGPICSELKTGQDVTLPDGTIVKSEDVHTPDIPGPVFIVLEIPDDDYLNSLIKNKSFDDYQSTGKLENQAMFIVHFTPENILNSKKYRDWMIKFPKTTEHIIINEYNNCYSYEALHRIQHQLTLLHPNIFPTIYDKNLNDNELLKNIDKECVEDSLKIYRAQTLDYIHLRPLTGLDSSQIVKIDSNADIAKVFSIEGFQETLENLKIDINNQLKNSNDQSEFPKLIVLGTGSSIPNKVRNTSGLLLRIDQSSSIVLDCGEGTVGQIIRFFGVKEADNILTSIKAIYISHLHADHHLGLLGILQERQRVTELPVYLFAPKQIESWLQFYDRKIENIKNTFNLVPNQCLIMNLRQMKPDVDDEINKILKIKDINTVEVNHCLHAFGLSLVLENGKKIVYSGDTKPCTTLVDLGKNCDLLIHEATMEDTLEDDARKKAHSTISQAIKIGQDMNAKFTLLTHFSQRYSKMPKLPESSTVYSLNNVGIAFDNMQVSLSELSLLPLFYPSLGFMFSDFCMTLEKKAEQRILKKKRQD